MKKINLQPAWVFYFFLEAQDGSPVAHDTAEELLDHIIAWVEERNLQIGGAFRPPTEEEMRPFSFSEEEN
jgi:hypothetical protein